MLHTEKIVKFKVDFLTGVHLPPPYSYNYQLEGRYTDAGLHLDYTLHYTDREDIDEAELLDEGFSLNDDRAFSTTIPLVWWQEFQKMLSQKPAKSKIEAANEMHIYVSDAEENTTEVNLGNQELWEYFIQEMVQAGLENEGLEEMLMLGFMLNTRQVQKHAEVQISFANRSFRLLTWHKDEHHTRNMPWSMSNQLMELVYSIDYEPEKARDKANGDGFFIQLSDGMWYKEGQAATDSFMPVIGKLKSTFNTWFG